MKKTGYIALLAVFAASLMGCGKDEAGELPPAPKPITQEDLDEMPPQARQRVENMKAYGESMNRAGNSRARR
jgi:predicted small lipoprotein YifL